MMQVDPLNETFSEPVKLDQDSEDFKDKFEELAEQGNIVSIGPQEHLQALKIDLIRLGYRKMK